MQTVWKKADNDWTEADSEKKETENHRQRWIITD